MASHTALLVIDVQVNQFQAPWAVHEGETVLRRINDLIQRARTAGAPVVYVRNCGTEIDPDREGTPGWELHPSLVPGPGEPVLDKTSCDTFETTPLDGELRVFGVRQLAITGLQSNLCVRETALGALARGWPVTLIEDAHSTIPDATRTAPEIQAEVNAELAGRVRLVKAEDFAFSE